jgi:hypothetical protein
LARVSRDLDRFLARVQDRSGQADAAVVELAVRATLRTVGSHLGGVPPALHDALPRALRPELAAGEGLEPVRPAELYQQVAQQAHVRAGVALELVQSTIAELAASLVDSALGLLRMSLPPAWAALVNDPVEARESSRPMPAARRTEGSGMFKLSDVSGAHRLATSEGSGAHKLATSEGSGAHRLANTEGSGAHKLAATTEGSGAHKLATGRPGSSRPLSEAQPPAGQANSIATSDDPHPKRLATAHGPGPEDEERTLADGQPGGRRTPIDSD